MFKLQPNPTFKTRVGISVAGTDKPVEIEVEFKYLAKKPLREYFDRINGRGANATPMTDEEGLAEIIVGWSGVDQPYSREALATLLENYPAAPVDLYGAFSRELMEAKRKN